MKSQKQLMQMLKLQIIFVLNVTTKLILKEV